MSDHFAVGLLEASQDIFAEVRIDDEPGER
jgi:hypothetical protein